MIKAIFLDFYGTIVQEDDDVIHSICNRIFLSGQAGNIFDIGNYWWKVLSDLFMKSCGVNYRTQRELEFMALKQTCDAFDSTEDAGALSQMMYGYWMAPSIFEDSKEFISLCKLPICIVSNIDTHDIAQALQYHHLEPRHIVTSEKARAYKPNKEIFRLAASEMGLSPHEVIHVGDSLSGDFYGAQNAGISFVWFNRKGRPVPGDVKKSVNSLIELLDGSLLS
jgi:HAD superfamily hydrolase (TIGR01493 family)